MSHRIFFIVALVVCFLGVSIFPVINLYVDSSRVLTRDFDYFYGNQANHVFLKAAWVIDNPDKYHSFIFGSSRVDAGFASNDFPDGWFKMSQPGGQPKEHVHNLKALLAHEIKIKEVWLTLDDFDIYIDRDLVNDYKLRPYPITLEEKASFLWFYLFRKPKKFERSTVLGKHTLTKNNFIHGFIEKEGIELEYSSYAEHDEMIRSLNAWSWDLSLKNKADIDSTISYVEEIKKLCDDNGIELKVIMTPRHYKVLYVRDYFNMAEFRRRLAQVMAYWDFSVITSTSYWKDNHYWLETSHFTTDIGRLMQNRIEEGSLNTKYDDQFGVLITPKNVNTVLAKNYETLLSELPAILKYDPNTRIDKSYLAEPKTASTTIETEGYSFAIAPLKEQVILTVAFNSIEPTTLQWQCGNTLVATTEVTKTDMGDTVRNFPWLPECYQDNKLVASKKEAVSQLSATFSNVVNPNRIH